MSLNIFPRKKASDAGAAPDNNESALPEPSAEVLESLEERGVARDSDVSEDGDEEPKKRTRRGTRGGRGRKRPEGEAENGDGADATAELVAAPEASDEEAPKPAPRRRTRTTRATAEAAEAGDTAAATAEPGISAALTAAPEADDDAPPARAPRRRAPRRTAPAAEAESELTAAVEPMEVEVAPVVELEPEQPAPTATYREPREAREPREPREPRDRRDRDGRDREPREFREPREPRGGEARGGEARGGEARGGESREPREPRGGPQDPVLRALDTQGRQIQQIMRIQEDMARRGGGGAMAAPRVGVFVDSANIELACDRLRVRFDWSKVLRLLTQDRQLVRAIAYSPTHDDPSVSIETQRFVEPFLDKGYKVVTKPLRRFHDGTIKANVDIELALDVVTMLDRLDVVCLVSGDGDFQRLVELCQSRGVRVEVVGVGTSTAMNLKHAADSFIDLGGRVKDLRV